MQRRHPLKSIKRRNKSCCRGLLSLQGSHATCTACGAAAVRNTPRRCTMASVLRWTGVDVRELSTAAARRLLQTDDDTSEEDDEGGLIVTILVVLVLTYVLWRLLRASIKIVRHSEGTPPPHSLVLCACCAARCSVYGFPTHATCCTARRGPGQAVMVIERMGRYKTTLKPGFHAIIPLIEQPRKINWRYLDAKVRCGVVLPPLPRQSCHSAVLQS